ncbi:MAG: hypothetical protein V7707_18790 [Motiliproteus sp.]
MLNPHITAFWMLIAASSGCAFAEKPPRIIPDQEIAAETETDTSVVPFVFSSESLGIALGAAAVAHHVGQPQVSLVGFGLYSSNDSWLAYLSGNYLQLASDSRWLVSTELYQGYSTQAILYLPGNTGYPDERAGSNESNVKDRIIRVTESNMARFRFEYITELGDGAQGAINSLYLQPNAGQGWNPAVNGVTILSLAPFLESVYIDDYDDPNYIPKAQGVQFGFKWDNRDSRSRSGSGGQSQFDITYDWGDSDRPDWLTWELSQSLFVPLGGNAIAHKQVLALNAFLGDTPTWNDSWDNPDGSTGYHRPPYFAGISLGGYQRLRGYGMNRYHDRSALLYSAEYRLFPRWQPLHDWPVFNLYNIPWWQWVAFVEAGRVADQMSLSTLHQDMQWNTGFGARLQVEGVVVRAEVAYAPDSSQFWVMVNQPF